jgi:hypothetical protein
VFMTAFLSTREKSQKSVNRTLLLMFELLYEVLGDPPVTWSFCGSFAECFSRSEGTVR